MEERIKEKSLGFGCAGMSGMNSFEFISTSYKPTFAQNPLLFYYLHFESNGRSFAQIHVERNRAYCGS